MRKEKKERNMPQTPNICTVAVMKRGVGEVVLLRGVGGVVEVVVEAAAAAEETSMEREKDRQGAVGWMSLIVCWMQNKV